MSSLAKIGPHQKSLKNSGWPTKLVIWLAVATPEVKMPSWLRGALAKSSRLIRHKWTKKFAAFCSYNDVDGGLDFICINGDMPSGRSHNLSRIGFESLERVKLAIPLSSSVAMWLKSTLAQTSLMFWKLNSWFFQMAMKADAYWFPGWDKGHIYQNEEMLIKSQVTRMHVLNICVSLTVHDTVCLHNLESRLLHNISSWFNSRSRETNCTNIKEILRVHLTVRTPSKD